MCKLDLKPIMPITVPDLFALEVVQECQHCQLCVLRENSIGCKRMDVFVPTLQRDGFWNFVELLGISQTNIDKVMLSITGSSDLI